MSETPNPCDLKLVILFDARDESCSVFSHNLSAENASQALDQLRHEGLFAFAVDQRSRHLAEHPDDLHSVPCGTRLHMSPRHVVTSAGDPLGLKVRAGQLPGFPQTP